jgi:hypothetical protein
MHIKAIRGNKMPCQREGMRFRQYTLPIAVEDMNSRTQFELIFREHFHVEFGLGWGGSKNIRSPYLLLFVNSLGGLDWGGISQREEFALVFLFFRIKTISSSFKNLELVRDPREEKRSLSWKWRGEGDHSPS